MQSKPLLTIINYPALILSAMVILFLAACNNRSVNSPDEKRPYIIPNNLLKKLVIDSVKQEELIKVTKLTGQVDFNREKQVSIFPLVSGTIQNIKVVLGDYIKQGEVLGVITSSEMAGFSNDLVNAESNLRLNEINLRRTKDMYKSGLASLTDSLGAEVSYQHAKSELIRINRVLKLNGGNTSGSYIIKAPINGFLVEKLVNNNMIIRSDNGNNLFTISDLTNVWILANVYESNIQFIRLGDPVVVTTLSYPGRVYKGKIDRIMNVLDPSNKVMKVRIVLDNKNYELKPQMFANIAVTNNENKLAPCISTRALIFDHSQYFVLVYESPSDIKIRPVQIINSVGDKTYISSGIKEGERVIGSHVILIYDALNS